MALLGCERPSLALWYADPLSGEVAEVLHAAAQEALQTRLCAGTPCFQLHVLQFVCRFWLEAATEPEYDRLAIAAGDRAEQALLEIVYGQLLISRKYRHAAPHLERGFAQAVRYLESSDYFRLVRRHELLGHLCVSDTPSPPQGLAALLAEAAVTRQLQAGGGHHYRLTHLDTIG